MKHVVCRLALLALVIAPLGFAQQEDPPTPHESRVALAAAAQAILDAPLESEALRERVRAFLARPAVDIFGATEEAAMSDEHVATARLHLGRITGARAALRSLVNATPLDRVLVRRFLEAVAQQTRALDRHIATTATERN